MTTTRGPAPRPRQGSAGGTRLGLFGGTFDPPHVAHLVAACWAGAELELDDVWLVVANQPWQKVDERPITAAPDRWAMVQALAADVPGVTACDVEIRRGGSSFTFDTVSMILADDPDTEIFVIVGADVAASLPTWHRPDDLRSLVTMAIVDRPGSAPPPVPAGWAFRHVVMPRLDITSTDLRERVALGRPIDGLVPPAVGSVIRDRGLYRGSLV